ncbi:hypothetical protein LTR37_011418 [Vermiconidia calcicola]|uniref:Uncharacterized protein n=1 Tax=Vermiconidia calcicola TaxID=1690605 RepID=A0ACC3N2K2_9PEZI|nr:hypothetical protein LTR37_011418 [Vermiconidia calcicola]
MGGAFVTFGTGGCVAELLLTCDFSSVTLTGEQLPNTPAAISKMLGDLGLQVALDCIHMLKAPWDELMSAIVTATDPRFPDILRSQLKEDPAHAGLTACAVAPKLPSWASARRISCKKVLVSWNKPVRLVWLNFGNRTIAERVSGKFNRGQYRVCGYTVKAGSPTSSETPRNPVAWTVLLQNVPATADTDDIGGSMSLEYDRPRHIEMGKATGSYDAGSAPTLVESLLTRIGPVEFNMRPESHGKRFKAIAMFTHEIDAREAVTSLHNQPQECLGQGRPTVTLLSSSKFKVSARIYKNIQKQLDAHVGGWHDQYVSFRVYPDAIPAKHFVTLKLEAQGAKEVAKATGIVEEILAGKIIRGEDGAFWMPSFAGNGPALEQLKQIEMRYEVLIERNRSKGQLRYFGPTDKFPTVQEAVIRELKVEHTSSHVIELSGEEFAWVCRGGLLEITAALGDDAVSFDVVSSPKRIVIAGSTDDHQHAISVLQHRKALPAIKPDLRNDDDCSICWTPAENPVTLDCQHVYCLDCFESLCVSSDSSGSKFAVRCQGGMGSCGKILELRELQAHLSSASLEEVLKASFKSYLRPRVNHYRYCPSPDCDYIYRANAGMQTCAKCLEVVCTECHEQHDKMTCADFKDLKSGGYEAFEAFKKQMKIKDCPKCKTPIEKTEGCNHMECGGCNIHICWVCLKTFSEGRPVYEHMNAEHGGMM